jgi:hypothetical protein
MFRIMEQSPQGYGYSLSEFGNRFAEVQQIAGCRENTSFSYHAQFHHVSEVQGYYRMSRFYQGSVKLVHVIDRLKISYRAHSPWKWLNLGLSLLGEYTWPACSDSQPACF